jgi:hypothetical protein
VLQLIRRKEIRLPNQRASSETLATGPLLRDLIRAQQADEHLLSYPELARLGVALEKRCRNLSSPLVWPVGDAAERLAGAAVLASEGRVRVRGWTEDVGGERVLLLATAAVSPLSLVQSAGYARALGAAEVHACGIEVSGIDCERFGRVFDSYGVLTSAQTRRAMLMPA